MQDIFKALAARAVMVFGLGAILVTMSEFWFYEITDDTDEILVLVAYGLLGYLLLAVVQRFRVRSRAGFVIAAALLGFLIEGVVVPVVYSAPPITIIWTSLAWHALISIGLGWVLLRRLLPGNPVVLALYCAGLGAFLGFWNGFMWYAQELDNGEVAFVWQPAQAFTQQFLFGYAVFLGGHVLFDRFYPRRARISAPEHLGLWAVAAILSVLTAIAQGLLAQYPLLPALVIICLWGLWREDRAQPPAATALPSYVDRLHDRPVALWRFGATALIPLAAIVVHGAIVAAEFAFETNALLFVIAAPASVGLFLWALFRLSRAGRGGGNPGAGMPGVSS